MTVVATYLGRCCREWILAYGSKGTCGLCGQVPAFVEHYEDVNEKGEVACTKS